MSFLKNYIGFIYTFICTGIELGQKFKNAIETKGLVLAINYLPIIVITILVITNSGKIESLDQENKDTKENIEQVFGRNKMYWTLPIINEESRPVGDDPMWKANNDTMNLRDINTSNRDNNNNN